MSSSDATITRKLTRWFRSNARDLPWRKKRSGYTALVSEAMLQQTQVNRVIEKYIDFMKRFPTTHALAAANEQEVLAIWQGLGYYRRARNLHAAAKKVMQEFDGSVPGEVSDLLTLPGVGRYTAGAIASIAFGKAEPIVDGNVHRVLARLAGQREFSAADAWLRAERLAEAAEQPGEFNEAMMELGATICTPAAPACAKCPLREHCSAHQDGAVSDIPAPKRAATPSVVHHHAVIVCRSGKVLLQQRPSAGLWSNMWQVPTIESTQPLAIDNLAHQLPFAVTALQTVSQFQHITTHRRITFHVHTARSRIRSGIWRSPDDVDDLPLSNAQKRIVAMASEFARVRASA